MEQDPELSSSLSPPAEVVGEEEAVTVVSEVDSPPPPPQKKKRGRPPKSQSGARQPPATRKEKEVEVEVACFVCLEGTESGDRIACDRRGCSKVYHRDCVNRHAAFFRSRGRRTCGWHICSHCRKAAQYMCYTCSYSSCKTCNGRAKFSCVRGNKGFCETCYATIMLIESNDYSDCKKVGVDFNNKSSWEYLFKNYWSALKGKLSLTLKELRAAKNPWKRSAHNEDCSDESYNANDDQEASSDSSSEYNDGNNSLRKKATRRLQNAAGYEDSVKQVESVEAEHSVKEADDKGPSMDIEWGSKELLEFVAHMKDGDTSCLSQFDVQALLLEYIKQKNLRDPRRKSQIICDSILENLFGKERVGHFEMLKLLESHFIMKGASHVIRDDNQGDHVESDSGQIDEGYRDSLSKITSDKRRKTHRGAEEREPQNNLDDYAAIDVHNINLIYLRRSLMEDLLDCAESDMFNEKVVGCFVRIRIPSTVKRQDMYRLVQVVGTSKTKVKYKIGKKTTDTLLHILNLQKTEYFTVDTISNQEFTKEECQRLRQSIKCGLLNRLTVGGVQEKARALQTLRIDDWLANEKIRLGHLRDRASEKGRRKELRECVEKLQLLNTREERRRMLSEVAEIHVDPKMDPSYVSSDEEVSDDKDQENCSKSRESLFFREGTDVSSGKEGLGPSKNWSSAWKISNTSSEANQNVVTEAADATPTGNPDGVWKSSCSNWDTKTDMIPDDARGKIGSFNTYGVRTNELPQSQETDVCHSSYGAPNAQAAISLSKREWNNNHPAVIPEKSHGAASLTMLVPPASEIPVQSWTNDAENLWHYHDPYGSIHGPFSMIQLRKWSTTGHFPPDLRIWQTSERPHDSILLADALIGKFQKHLPQWKSEHNSFPRATQFSTAMDNGQKMSDGGQRRNGGRWMNHPAAWSAPRAEVLRGWETTPNAWVGQPQAHGSLKPAIPNSGYNYQPPPFYGRGGRGRNAGRWNQGQDHGNGWNSNRPRRPEPNGQGYERQLSNWGSSGKSFGEPWKSQTANDSRNQWPNDSFSLSTPTPQPSDGGWVNSQGVTPSASTYVGSGWGATTGSSNKLAHQFPDGTMEPRKSAADRENGCWVSSSMSVMKQTDKTDGWGSWSTASDNKVKHTDGWGTAAPKKTDNADGLWSEPARTLMLKKADKVDGLGSWSAASANKIEHTDGWGTSASKQTEYADSWCSGPAETPMLKQPDKTDGWGSWSAASANKVKHTDCWGTSALKQTDNVDGSRSEPAGTVMLKQTDKIDGWGSFSAASANKVKHTDGWGTVAPKQKDNAAGWHSELAGAPMLDKVKMLSSCLGTEDAPPNLENQSCCNGRMDLPNSSMSISGSGTNELNGAMNKNQSIQGGCIHPTSLSERQGLLGVQANESGPASTFPAVEDLPNSAMFVSGSGANELSGAMNKNQLLQVDCPSPSPLSERQGLLEVQAPAARTTDLSARLSAVADNDLQSVLNVLAEDGLDKGPTTVSEAQNCLLLQSVMESKLVHPVASTMPMTEPVLLEASSTQRYENSLEPKLVSESQNWGPTEKRDQNCSTPSSAASESWKQNWTLSQPDTNVGEWSLPSPTPPTRLSGPDAGTDSTFNNGEHNPWVTSDGCKQPSSQLISDAFVEPQQTSKAEWGNEAKAVPSTGWDHMLVHKNPNRDTGTVSYLNVNSKTDRGTPALGSSNKGTAWGPSAPKGTNGNTGWGAPPESTNANTNWGSQVPEETNAKAVLGAASQESLKPNDRWEAPAQGSSNLSTGGGNTKQNLNWGASTMQVNANANSGWGTGNGDNIWVSHHNQGRNMYDMDMVQ